MALRARLKSEVEVVDAAADPVSLPCLAMSPAVCLTEDAWDADGGKGGGKTGKGYRKRD